LIQDAVTDECSVESPHTVRWIQRKKSVCDYVISRVKEELEKS
jgi:hypothetical protein